jgi:transcriptional regulator with XRE-family HTH domain
MILENITRLCKEKGVSIAKLERETGISNGTISRWGVSSPTVNNLKAVADYFGVALDDLTKERQDFNQNV